MVGDRQQASIAVTHGLVRRLSTRELLGMLVHEISHVRHNDMWVMGMADLFTGVTGLLSTADQFLLLLNLPLLLLSSAREYDADLGAVKLTGPPEAPASALAKIDPYQGWSLEQVLLLGRWSPDRSFLRTHPETKDRICRLRGLTSDLPETPALGMPPAAPLLVDDFARVVRTGPRWYFNGLQY